jgi:hypothetical protein
MSCEGEGGRFGLSIGNSLIVRMLRLASGFVNTANHHLSGWIRVLPAGLFSPSRAFSICSERRLYRQRLRLKAHPGEKTFSPSRPKAASPFRRHAEHERLRLAPFRKFWRPQWHPPVFWALVRTDNAPRTNGLAFASSFALLPEP